MVRTLLGYHKVILSPSVLDAVQQHRVPRQLIVDRVGRVLRLLNLHLQATPGKGQNTLHPHVERKKSRLQNAKQSLGPSTCSFYMRGKFSHSHVEKSLGRLIASHGLIRLGSHVTPQPTFISVGTSASMYSMHWRTS